MTTYWIALSQIECLVDGRQEHRNPLTYGSTTWKTATKHFEGIVLAESVWKLLTSDRFKD